TRYAEFLDRPRGRHGIELEESSRPRGIAPFDPRPTIELAAIRQIETLSCRGHRLERRARAEVQERVGSLVEAMRCRWNRSRPVAAKRNYRRHRPSLARHA